MGTLITQFSEALRKLEEAVEVIRTLTGKIREELGDEPSVPLFQSTEELVSRLFPGGLDLEKLNGELQKAKGAAKDSSYTRVTLIQEVEYEGEAGRFRSRLTEISEGGIFIDTFAPFSPGAIVKVKFRLPNFEEPIDATAEVCHAREGVGMGVQFLDLKPEDRNKIKELVETSSSRGERMSREEVKTSRVNIKIPVTLKGTGRDGASFEERATLITLSKNGACILTDRDLAEGMMLFLSTPKGVEFKASIIWVGNKSKQTKGQVGIQCPGLAQAFGLYFPTP